MLLTLSRFKPFRPYFDKTRSAVSGLMFSLEMANEIEHINSKYLGMCVCVCVCYKPSVSPCMNLTTLALLLKLPVCEKRIVWSSLWNHMKDQDSLRLIFYYFPSKCFQFCMHPSSFSASLLFLVCPSGSATGVLFLFLCPWSVSQWQWWESIEVLCCHVSQIRCYNRKWLPVHGCAQWHTHMTYCHCQPNGGLAVTDTLTQIRHGSKVAAVPIKQGVIFILTRVTPLGILCRIQEELKKIMEMTGCSCLIGEFFSFIPRRPAQ